MSLEAEIHKDRGDQALWFRALTWPLEGIYKQVSDWNDSAYAKGRKKTVRLAQPVISIGNITLGGTGKSPVVMSLCSYLKESGLRPAVLTRGYGAKIPAPGWMAVLGHKTICGYGIVPDEAAMQAALLHDVPVVIGPDRVQAAQGFLAQVENKPDVWVMDDGFQHRRLVRDVDLVCIDDRQRFGNGRLLPAGPLRESIEGLARATGVLFTRSPATERAHELVVRGKSIPSFHMAFRYPQPVPLRSFFGDLSGDSSVIPGEWAVVCGIAQPDRFVSELKSQGLCIVDTLFFRDHQNIDASRFRRWLREIPKDRPVGLLITAKDAYRNRDLFLSLPIPVFVQPLDIADAEQVWAALVPEFAKP